jgi:hypothetical protein
MPVSIDHFQKPSRQIAITSHQQRVPFRRPKLPLEILYVRFCWPTNSMNSHDFFRNKMLIKKRYQKTNKTKSLNLTNPDPAGIDP